MNPKPSSKLIREINADKLCCFKIRRCKNYQTQPKTEHLEMEHIIQSLKPYENIKHTDKTVVF